MQIIAKGEITVHRKVGDSELPRSVILLFGDSLDETEVPDYVLQDVKDGKVPLLELVSASDAKKTKKEADAARMEHEATRESKSSVSITEHPGQAV